MILGIVVLVNVISSFIHTSIDLTGDKRYTLTNPTKELLETVDEQIYIRILLDGKFPAGFKRLKSATQEILEDFRSIAPDIQYVFENPSEGSTEQINQKRSNLAQDGIIPVNLDYFDGKERVMQYIYPFAIVNYGSRKSIVNLLEEQAIGVPEELTLNNSVSLLEYKFADAIQKLMLENRPNILFTEGRGELDNSQIASLRKEISKDFNTDRIHLDSIYQLSPEIDLIIVAGPTENFDLRSQFILDQYIMNGGKIIWLIDYLNANLDSINANKFFVPEVHPIGLEELFFKYGIRIQPNLVLDLECTRIPQVTGMSGDQVQTALFPWYYHPLVAPKSNHPIVKNLDRINMYFPSTIDTLKTKTALKKEILLSSSAYSRYQITPMRLNFEILRYEPDPSKFDKGSQPLAVLLEGPLESAFQNRVSEAMLQTLDEIDASFVSSIPNSKQLFISDSDFIKNLYSTENNRITPVGYNKWEQQIFKANKDFILNSIEHMLDQNGVLNARSKEVKLRMLNIVKAKQEKTKWQLINILLPVIIVLIFGLFYHLRRKKIYT